MSFLVLARSRGSCLYSTAAGSPPPSDPASSSNGLRQLMRKVAQPVAVITANLKHADKLDEPGMCKKLAVLFRVSVLIIIKSHADHGATISSFVSIALHPTPLVAFALRLPSRLATFLNTHHSSSSSPSSSSSMSDHLPAPTFKIHLLSEEQEDVARAFARQAPLPNKAMPSSSSTSQHEPFSLGLFQKLDATSLGSLECTLAGDLPLVEPLFQTHMHNADISNPEVQSEHAKASKIGQATSQLFIAKVINVNGGDTSRHPLLYYHQKYCVLDME